MSKFTEGEWEYEEYVPGGVTINGREYLVSTAEYDVALVKIEADARLIVAAPKMYDVLDTYVTRFEYGVEDDYDLYSEAKALLARLNEEEVSEE